jgi:hypothetical protein
MEVTASVKADAALVRITAVLPNGFEPAAHRASSMLSEAIRWMRVGCPLLQLRRMSRPVRTKFRPWSRSAHWIAFRWTAWKSAVSDSETPSVETHRSYPSRRCRATERDLTGARRVGSNRWGGSTLREKLSTPLPPGLAPRSPRASGAGRAGARSLTGPPGHQASGAARACRAG